MVDLSSHFDAWLDKETALITNPTPLLVLAVLLVSGYVFGKLAKMIRLPAVTGQIFAGVIVGHYVLNLFGENSLKGFSPITNFALGFIGFTIGSHLDIRRLKSAGRRILSITLCDIIVTPLIVFGALHWIARVPFEPALLIAAIAAVTDPGALLHVVKEKRSKGILTKTILASVAVNNVLALLLFYTVYYYLIYHHTADGFTLFGTVGPSLWLLAESLITGGGVGLCVIFFTEKHKTTISFLTMVFLAIVLTVGTSETLHFSGTLSCLILGMVITNFSHYRNRIFSAFRDLEKEVFLLLFVLAGTHLDFGAMITASVAGATLIVARLAGKTAGVVLGARLGGTGHRIRRWSGISMYTLGGLAIGLALLCGNTEPLAAFSNQITAIVLAAVVFFELVAPLATGAALSRAGEAGKDRIRLLDFLEEEYITTGLEATDKWEALSKMAAFLHHSHRCHDISLKELKRRVVDREKEISTGIGDNIAIPHAIVDGGPKIRGVIGVSTQGIEFNSMDGKPVHIIIMIATPRENYDLHLQVLANISKIFGSHPHIKEDIINCRKPEEVFEILQAEEVELLNPFFEE